MDEASVSTPPQDPEWLKLDTIVLSWIFITCSKTLQDRLVDNDPQTAKEAWDLLESIFTDNKRSRAVTLKADLRALTLGDMSIDAYFRKIESTATLLARLGAPISNDDLVSYALAGLPEKYDGVSLLIAHREPFPDLKTVRSMLTTEEMRLKSRPHTTFVDGSSSSPLALVTKSGSSNLRRSTVNTSSGKINKPCFNFASGYCRFGEHCPVTQPILGLTSPPGFTQQGPSVSQSTSFIQQLANSLVQQGAAQQQSSAPTASSGSDATTVTECRFLPKILQDPIPGNWNFVRDNQVALLKLDPFGFSVKDFQTRRVLLRCDSSGDLYPVTESSSIPHVFLTSQYTWHQRLGHLGSEVLRRVLSNNSISCNKEKSPVLCHACQLGKHVKLSFVRSSTFVSSCFDIIHSDLWTSPIPSLSGFKYYVVFLDHYSQYVWVYPLVRKSDVLSII
ncbi:ribonuclease H-like domain-containing protein [Tanacetum coccineum]